MINRTDWVKISKYPLKNETFRKKEAIAKVLEQKYKQSKKKRKRRLIIVRIAACLAVSIGCVEVAYQASAMRMTTNTSKAQYLLPDGSEVTIHPHSEIKYNKLSWLLSREVIMAGTAEFNVTKGDTQFKVKASRLDVYVLGTILKISERDDTTDVYCTQGAVMVKSAVTEQKLGPDSKISVTDDTFTFSSNYLPCKSEPQVENTSQSLVYAAIPLSELVSEMQRIYKQTFSITPSIGSILYSGPLLADDLDTTLELISQSCHIRIRKEKDTIILY